MIRKLFMFSLMVMLMIGGYFGARIFIASVHENAVLKIKNRQEVTQQKGVRELVWLAKLGHAPSQSLLGEIYAYGVKTPRDRDEAIKWFRRAAANSDFMVSAASKACFVGMDFIEGHRTKRDLAEASWWLDYAKESGYTCGPTTRASILVAVEVAYNDYWEHLFDKSTGDNKFGELDEKMENYEMNLRKEGGHYIIEFKLIHENGHALQSSGMRYKIDMSNYRIIEKDLLE